MHTFLSGDSSDKKRIFTLVKKDALETLMKNFSGVKVQTLSGNCTRSLHQIKAGPKPGNILQRPYSCFCTMCRNNKYELCHNSTVTLGKFQMRQLKSTDVHGNIEEKENVNEEENDENIEMNCDGVFLEGEVPIQEEELQLENLNIGDFVVVVLKNTRS